MCTVASAAIDIANQHVNFAVIALLGNVQQLIEILRHNK